MPINTIITLIIGIFGANITLIAAIRAQHDSDLKRIAGNLTRTVNEFRSLVKTCDCPGAKAAAKAEKDIPSHFNSWHRSITWLTWGFAIYVIIVTAVFIFMKWPDSSSGQASSNEVTEFVALHCLYVKGFIGAFLIFNIGCFFTAVYAQRQICYLISEVKTSTEDAKAAISSK